MRGEHRGERGVSPVVATILLVAVVVILAAVATVAINDAGLGKGKEPAPQVAFEPHYDVDSDELRLTHQAGEKLETGQIEIRAIGGDGAYTTLALPARLETGDHILLGGIQDDERIVFIWTSTHDHKDKHVIYRWDYN